MISKASLDMAVQYYNDYGVVTEHMMGFGSSLTRELFRAMRDFGCEGIEDAVETEYVIDKDGKRYDYYEVIYNRKRFSNTDEVNDFLLKTKLHMSD